VNKEEFYSRLAEILEVGSVTDEHSIGKDAIDSMQILSVISLIDEMFGVQIAAKTIQEAPNAGAIWAAVDAALRER
jgi:acyl carrier protein